MGTPFEALLARLRERRPELPAALAFLEHMSPRSADCGAGACRARAYVGYRLVPPVFRPRRTFARRLSRRSLRRAFGPSEIDFEIAPAAGEAPPVIDALADFALDGLDRAVPSKAMS